VMQQQVDEMREAGYGRSEVLDSQVTVLNATSAPYRGTFSRQRSDGTELSRLTATYLGDRRPARPPHFSAGGS
jgi:hypothetical protein